MFVQKFSQHFRHYAQIPGFLLVRLNPFIIPLFSFLRFCTGHLAQNYCKQQARAGGRVTERKPLNPKCVGNRTEETIGNKIQSPADFSDLFDISDLKEEP